MDSIKELVRQKIRIEDVIGSYVTLVPFGKNFKACCPFHNEKTPSFNINTEKQMFYCFGCKKGGDVFSFIQEIERVDFKESLKMLAEKAGVDIHQSKEVSKELRQKKSLLQIHEYATRFYQILLSYNPQVVTYLETRGITKDSIKKWRIGFIPDGFSQLTRVLQKKGFSNEDLIASGLMIQGNKGIYDRFRGRIMFPIADSSGKVIAFSGRVMPGTQESARDTVGKYINSPETALYRKGQILFGFHWAKSAMMEKKQVILVEGQFDAILAHQVGSQNTVAISGTACTEHHIEQISRFVDEVVIATDRDRAGIASAHKITELVYQFDKEVSMVVLPEGKDPADIIHENVENWLQLLKDKKDFITFHIHSSEQEPLRARLESVKKYLFPVIARLTNDMYRDTKLQLISRELSVSIESIRSEFQKYLSVSQTPVYQSPQVKEKHVVTHRDVYAIQLQEWTLIHHYFERESGFWFQEHPEVAQLIHQYTIELTPQYVAEQTARYQDLDSLSWKTRLDTLWIRTQQIMLDVQTDQLRSKIHQESDPLIAEQLQHQLLALRTKKEALVRSLSV